MNMRAPIVVETPEAFHQMPEEYRELVIRQLTIHAAGELSGADDYVHLFYPLAPNAYERKVCCEAAVDEMEHYSRAAAVLADLGVDVSYLLEKSIHERDEYATELVRGVETWAERACVSFLGESAVIEILEELKESSYKPAARMFPQVIQEERLHVAHGFRILRELCRTEEGRAESQAAVDKFWPISLDLFGTADSERNLRFQHWGLRQNTNEEARQRFVRNHAKHVERLGLKVPDPAANRKFF